MPAIRSNCDVMEEETIERPCAWLFFIENKRFIETRNYRDGLLGVGSILVEQNSGDVSGVKVDPARITRP
jgi:hypothetical protein